MKGIHRRAPKRGPIVARRGLALGLIMSLFMAGIALADNVQNDVTVGGSDTIVAGGSTQVLYRITATNNDGQPRCNADDGTPAKVTINAPAGVTVSSASFTPPNTLTFNACGVANAQSVTFSSTAVGNHSITVSVVDAGSTNIVGTYTTAQAAFTLKVLAAGDQTPPTIVGPMVSGQLGNNGWYVDDVTVAWEVAEDESPLSLVKDGCDTTVADDTDGLTLGCSATSDGGTTIGQSVTIMRDATKPETAVLGVPDQAVTLGSEPAITCATTDAMSGVGTDASLAITPTDATVGFFTATCSGAVDNAGNVGDEATATYQVVYAFNGFFRPVDMGSTMNVVKAGSAIPVKFSLNGNQGMEIFMTGFPLSIPVNCPNAANSDPIEVTVTAGNSSLSYDASSGQYNYVWKTVKTWTGCRELQVRFIDGTTKTALFQFTK